MSTYGDDANTDLRPERGYPKHGRTNAPAWILAFVILAAIVGAIGYETGPWGHRAGVNTVSTPMSTQAPAPATTPAKP